MIVGESETQGVALGWIMLPRWGWSILVLSHTIKSVFHPAFSRIAGFDAVSCGQTSVRFPVKPQLAVTGGKTRLMTCVRTAKAR